MLAARPSAREGGWAAEEKNATSEIVEVERFEI